MVACLGDNASPALSAGLGLTPREVSSGTQDYEEKEQNFPLNSALPAVTSLQQVCQDQEHRLLDMLLALKRILKRACNQICAIWLLDDLIIVMHAPDLG